MLLLGRSLRLDASKGKWGITRNDAQLLGADLGRKWNGRAIRQLEVISTFLNSRPGTLIKVSKETASVAGKYTTRQIPRSNYYISGAVLYEIRHYSMQPSTCPENRHVSSLTSDRYLPPIASTPIPTIDAPQSFAARGRSRLF